MFLTVAILPQKALGCQKFNQQIYQHFQDIVDVNICAIKMKM